MQIQPKDGTKINKYNSYSKIFVVVVVDSRLTGNEREEDDIGQMTRPRFKLGLPWS